MRSTASTGAGAPVTAGGSTRIAAPPSSVYEAHLRWALTASLGVRWEAAPGRTAEIVGVPPAVRGEFSSRGADVRRHEFETARGHRVAWAATRPPKVTGTSYAELVADWRRRAGGGRTGARGGPGTDADAGVGVGVVRRAPLRGGDLNDAPRRGAPARRGRGLRRGGPGRGARPVARTGDRPVGPGGAGGRGRGPAEPPVRGAGGRAAASARSPPGRRRRPRDLARRRPVRSRPIGSGGGANRWAPTTSRRCRRPGWPITCG